MKFGVREICDVVFKAKADVKIGNKKYRKGQPVLYIDSAKTSTVEGAATAVYAQGGVGNSRLIAWEGEKTLTFTVEDALLSPIGFSMLSGAGLLGGTKADKGNVRVHTTALAYVSDADGHAKIDLADVVGGAYLSTDKSNTFVAATDEDGSLTGEFLDVQTIDSSTNTITLTAGTAAVPNGTVFVDFYVIRPAANVSELQIDAKNFAGYYYVEARTLFRRQADGVDMPAEITFPNVKIQSNFTFTMASTGDPSTFTFTMDAFPGYTKFDNTKKVLCVIQVVDDANETVPDVKTVMGTDEKPTVPVQSEDEKALDTAFAKLTKVTIPAETASAEKAATVQKAIVEKMANPAIVVETSCLADTTDSYITSVDGTLNAAHKNAIVAVDYAPGA